MEYLSSIDMHTKKELRIRFARCSRTIIRVEGRLEASCNDGSGTLRKFCFE